MPVVRTEKPKPPGRGAPKRKVARTLGSTAPIVRHGQDKRQPRPSRIPRNARALQPHLAGPDETGLPYEVALEHAKARQRVYDAGRPMSPQQHGAPEEHVVVVTSTHSQGEHRGWQRVGECRSTFAPKQGVFFRSTSDPTRGRWGAFRCRGRGCPVHGKDNRAAQAHELAQRFPDGGCYRVEVDAKKGWAALRKRFSRAHDLGYTVAGWKVPMVGDQLLVLFDVLTVPVPGARWEADAEAVLLYGFGREDHESGRKLTGLGGWKVTPAKKPGADLWVADSVTSMPRMELTMALEAAGFAPHDVDDDQLPDDFADAFDLKLPARGTVGYERFLQVAGAQRWEDWLKDEKGQREQKKRQREQAELDALLARTDPDTGEVAA